VAVAVGVRTQMQNEQLMSTEQTRERAVRMADTMCVL